MSVFPDNQKIINDSRQTTTSPISAEQRMRNQVGSVEKNRDALRDQLASQTVVNKILALSLKGDSLDNLLQEALTALAELPFMARGSSTAVFLNDPRRKALFRVAEHNAAQVLKVRCKGFVLGECLCGRAAREGKTIFTEHLAECRNLRHPGEVDHVAYFAPLLAQDHLVGMLVVLLPSGHGYHQLEAEALTNIAHILAGLILRKQAEKEESRIRHRLENMWKWSRLAETDFEAVSQEMLGELLRITGSRYGFFGMVSRDQAILQNVGFSEGVMRDCNMTVGIQQFPISGGGIWAAAIRNRRPLIVNDYSKQHQAKKGLPPGHVPIIRLMAVPAFSAERNTMLAAVANKTSDYTSEDIRRVKEFLDTIQPIMERHQAEFERKRSDELLQLMVKGVEDYALILLDRQGCVIGWSAGAEKIIGYRRDEIIGKHTSLFYPDEAVGEKRPETALKSALTHASFRKKALRVRKNGTTFWADVTITTLKDLNGEVRGFAKLVRDITEEVKTLEFERGIRRIKDNFVNALQDVSQVLDIEEVLRKFLRIALDLTRAEHGVIFTAEKGKPVKLIRVDAEEKIIGRSCPLFFHELTKSFISSEKKVRWVNLNADPRLRVLAEKEGIPHQSLLLVPLCYGEEPVGFLYLFGKTDGESFTGSDLTALEMLATHAAVAVNNALLYSKIRSFNEKLQSEVTKRTSQLQLANQSLENANARIRESQESLKRINRQLQQANEAKSKFLANMSHELRTPLNSILGFSQVLMEEYFGTLNEKQREYVKDIMESGEHLLSLINDILDLAKVEAGKSQLVLSKVCVGNLIERSLVMIKEKALKHGIELHFEATPEVRELELLADERKLRQILYNLLSNAVKCTQDGGSIRLSAKVIERSALPTGRIDNGDESSSSNFIHITIEDTGIGIAPEDLEKIFDPFHRAAQSETREGTGLGLSLTRELVTLHGGRIWAESSGKNQGSRFSFIIPVTLETDTPSSRNGMVRCALGQPMDINS